jgi:hypothetical protein
MSGIFIRILGGAIGVIISGQLYDYYNRQTNKNIQYKHNLDIELEKDKNTNTNTTLEYKKDKFYKEIESILIKELELELEPEPEKKNNDVAEQENVFVNDAIYDCSYYDYYFIIGRE